MEPTTFFIGAGIGAIVGAACAWAYLTLRTEPLPTAKDMVMIVTQAIDAVSYAATIEGKTGSKRAEVARDILRKVLTGAKIKLDDRLLTIVVEAIYQYGKVKNAPID